MANKKPGAKITGCIRCGTCCRKGGPSFHWEDRSLIEQGLISIKYLYTIRKGEPAYDNICGRIIRTDSDIIKIKGQKNLPTCVFFNIKECCCTIYANRPVECRVLTCWDTTEIERIYAENRLTRKNLLSTVAGLWDLIKDHQARCGYDKIRALMHAPDSDKKDKDFEDVFEMIRYDKHLRQLVAKKGDLDPEITDFLFGRPLAATLLNIYPKLFENR